MRLTLAAAAFGAFLSLLVAVTPAQTATSSAEIKVTVVDQSGARIPGSEVVFKHDSKMVVSHTGEDGAVTVTLPSGQYAVTMRARGFMNNNVADFQVVAPVPGELSVVLMLDPVFSSTPMCGPCAYSVETPTITSDLPNVIEDELRPVPPAPPATKARKSRSGRCLYLWKCSIS